MFFQQVYDKSLAQASYVIGCQVSGEAMVIDPKRDIDTYIQIAALNKLTITHIAETHIHADFLCGSRELAQVTGAKLYLSDEGGENWQYEFDHIGLKDGDSIKIGNLSFAVLHTPGHTPESISFLLTDHPSTDKPVMVFTGDFVFVGDVGRPDLLEKAAGFAGTKETGARQLFNSIQRFKNLPDYIQLWPGHGAGSACGKSLGAVPSSTVGYEKIRNWAFQYEDDFEGFMINLLTDQPEPPRYFSTMKKWNKVNRPLLTKVPLHPTLVVNDISDKLTVIDTRHKVQFAEGHLAKSINIQNNNALANWTGWMIDYTENLALIASEEDVAEITRKLMRIGMDNIVGFVTTLRNADLLASNIIAIDEVERMRQDSDTILLDVRSEVEYRNGHIPGAIHWFIGRLPKELPTHYKANQVVVYCQSGDRATIAYSYLKKEGFANVYNYTASYAEWKALNKPIELGAG